MTGIILVFTGLPVLRGAYISLKMRRPNTDLLVAITAVSAYAYSTAAVVLGQNDIFYDPQSSSRPRSPRWCSTSRRSNSVHLIA